MIEKAIEVRTKDGIADGFLYQPAEYGKWPGVIHLTDIVGIRPANRQMAERLASKGYVVALPNVFYRTSKPPVFDLPFKMGDERTTKRIAELKAPLTPMAMQSDATAYVDFLAKQESVRSGPMGGYRFLLHRRDGPPNRCGAAG
jgi:carboxymethylenebutenolidase